MREQVNEVWEKYNSFKKTAEQHDFVKLLMFDSKLIPAYNDLQNNWDDDHAQKFINAMKNVVFKQFGIK